MGTIGRVRIASIWTVGLLVLGVIFYQVFQPILDIDQGGQFSFVIGWIDVIVPIVIVSLIFASWLWVVIGSVTEQPRRDMRVRP